MTSITTQLMRNINVQLNFGNLIPQIVTVGTMRLYSIYPPNFVKPVYDPKKIQELIESGEAKSFKFTPVLPVNYDRTSSVFHDPIVAKFTNYVMKSGGKALARDLVEKTFETIKRMQLEKYHSAKTAEEKAEIDINPLVIFHKAVENTRPIMNVSKVKRGGHSYQVPTPLTSKISYFIGMRWLRDAGKEKFRTIHFPEKMAKEFIAAANKEGIVIKKKHDLHRLCEANRAYAHYRWG